MHTTKRLRLALKVILICAFACFLMGSKVDCPQADGAGGSSHSGTLDCGGLAGLYRAAGGSWGDSSLMADIAMAGSAGNQYAHQSDGNGTDDEGYWQINSANEGTYYPTGADRYDPMTNAKAAVAIHDGIGLSAWTEYSNDSYRQFDC